MKHAPWLEKIRKMIHKGTVQSCSNWFIRTKLQNNFTTIKYVGNIKQIQIEFYSPKIIIVRSQKMSIVGHEVALDDRSKTQLNLEY